MPRTTLTPIQMPGPYATAGVALTWTAADVVNGNDFVATGNEILLARNTDGVSAHTVSVQSAPDPYAREGDITGDSIPANGYRTYQRFPVVGWQRSDGRIYVDADDASIEFAVLRLP